MAFKEGIFKYLFWVIIGYVSWLILYEFWLLPHTLLDEMLIHGLVKSSSFILSILGYSIQNGGDPWLNIIALDYRPGVWISPNCDGLSVVVIYCIVISSFPGTLSRKFVFLFLGSLCVELANVIRIVSLAIIHRNHPEWLKFNHDYTFTIFVYAIVIGWWWLWFKKKQSALS
jgi:exosortase/archaeosortase family protein